MEDFNQYPTNIFQRIIEWRGTGRYTEVRILTVKISKNQDRSWGAGKSPHVAWVLFVRREYPFCGVCILGVVWDCECRVCGVSIWCVVCVSVWCEYSACDVSIRWGSERSGRRTKKISVFLYDCVEATILATNDWCVIMLKCCLLFSEIFVFVFWKVYKYPHRIKSSSEHRH